MAARMVKRRASRVKKIPPTSPFSQANTFGKDLRKRLELIHAVCVTVATALIKENAEHGVDFAAVLTRCAADPLWEVIARLSGEEVTP